MNKQTLSYDARGNLLNDRNERRRFEYDITNRLSAYYNHGALRASYAYNASGQRIEKTLHNVGPDGEATRTTNFAYTPDGWCCQKLAAEMISP